MKKAIVPLIMLSMLFAMYACGNTSSPEDSPGQTASAAPTVSAVPAMSNDAGEEEAAKSEEPQYGGTIRIITGDTSTGFGLPWEMAMRTQDLMTPFGETLFTETTGAEWKPLLADSWEVDPVNLQIRFRIREGIKFSDGSDLNAEICAWNINKQVEAGACNAAVTSAEATGEYELVVHVSNYVNSTFTHFASHVSAMVSKENYDTNGEDYARENPVGTGPFLLKETVPGEHVSFVRNDAYWQEGKPYLDGVDFIEITDVMTQNAAMQGAGTGAADVLRTSSAEQMQLLESSVDGFLMKIPTGPYCLIPSSAKEDSPFAKLEVRQAVFYSIDRDAICEARGFGVWTPAYQLFTKPYKGYYDEAPEKNGYDPEKTKQLLADAGYPDGFATTIYGLPGGDKDAVIAVQNMLEAVGITCTAEFPESGAATDLRFNGWDGILVTQLRNMINSTSTLALNIDPGNKWLPSLKRPGTGTAYEDLYMAARTTKDLQQDMMETVHRMLMDEMICVPVYNTYECFVIRNSIQNSGFGEHTQSTIWLPWDTWKLPD
jgi:ABC-type transport system substrate-binding protein